MGVHWHSFRSATLLLLASWLALHSESALGARRVLPETVSGPAPQPIYNPPDQPKPQPVANRGLGTTTISGLDPNLAAALLRANTTSAPNKSAPLPGLKAALVPEAAPGVAPAPWARNDGAVLPGLMPMPVPFPGPSAQPSAPAQPIAAPQPIATRKPGLAAPQPSPSPQLSAAPQASPSPQPSAVPQPTTTPQPSAVPQPLAGPQQPAATPPASPSPPGPSKFSPVDSNLAAAIRSSNSGSPSPSPNPNASPSPSPPRPSAAAPAPAGRAPNPQAPPVSSPSPPVSPGASPVPGPAGSPPPALPPLTNVSSGQVTAYSTFTNTTTALQNGTSPRPPAPAPAPASVASAPAVPVQQEPPQTVPVYGWGGVYGLDPRLSAAVLGQVAVRAGNASAPSPCPPASPPPLLRDPLCDNSEFRDRALKLLQERPFASLFEDLHNHSVFQANGLAYANSQYYVLFEGQQSIGILADSLPMFSHRNQLVRKSAGNVPHAPYAAISFRPDTSSFLVFENQGGGGGPEPTVKELQFYGNQSGYTTLRTCTLDFNITTNFDSIHFFDSRHEGKLLLALCELNDCAENKATATYRGNGRIILSRLSEGPGDGECAWTPERVIPLPPTAAFQDYSGLAFRGDRAIVTSAGDSAVWVGTFDWDALEFRDGGQMFFFPRNDQCEVVYCTVHGVQWVDDFRITVASNAAGLDQPWPCVAKGQAIQQFMLPPMACDARLACSASR